MYSLSKYVRLVLLCVACPDIACPNMDKYKLCIACPSISSHNNCYMQSCDLISLYNYRMLVQFIKVQAKYKGNKLGNAWGG